MANCEFLFFLVVFLTNWQFVQNLESNNSKVSKGVFSTDSFENFLSNKNDSAKNRFESKGENSKAIRYIDIFIKNYNVHVSLMTRASNALLTRNRRNKRLDNSLFMKTFDDVSSEINLQRLIPRLNNLIKLIQDNVSPKTVRQNLYRCKHSCCDRSDVSCSVEGSWTSKLAGIIDVTHLHSSLINVTFNELATKENFIPSAMNNTYWKISGVVPFGKTGLIVLNAINRHNNRIANFIGSCKLCDGAETVCGKWLVSGNVRNCRGEMMKPQVIRDIWIRSNLRENDMKPTTKVDTSYLSSV